MTRNFHITSAHPHIYIYIYGCVCVWGGGGGGGGVFNSTRKWITLSTGASLLYKYASLPKALMLYCQSDPEMKFEIGFTIIMSAVKSQITSVSIVYSLVCSDADKKNHQSSASLAVVRGIHRWPMNSPHKGPVTRKMFPFDDVIMYKMSFFSPKPQCAHL